MWCLAPFCAPQRGKAISSQPIGESCMLHEKGAGTKMWGRKRVVTYLGVKGMTFLTKTKEAERKGVPIVARKKKACHDTSMGNTPHLCRALQHLSETVKRGK